MASMLAQQIADMDAKELRDTAAEYTARAIDEMKTRTEFSAQDAQAYAAIAQALATQSVALETNSGLYRVSVRR